MPVRAGRAAGAALAAAALLASLSGCSLMDRAISGDKVDYKSTVNSASRPTLEVPPDLTQLSADNRYSVPGPSGQSPSTVSASTFRPPAQASTVTTPPVLPGAAPGTPGVAPEAVGNFRIERSSDLRWLSTSETPEQLWPQLKAFWQEKGFTLSMDQPDVGVMETDWAENRAKLPNDIIRNTLGRVIDSLYSTGERDRFRTRVERTPKGSEVYVTHRGMIEVYTSQMKDQTVWQPRQSDPQLEAEFLSRMMISLGNPPATGTNVAGAPGSAASAPTGANVALAPARARVLTGLPSAALQVDEKFDRAWRGVGLALDRSGFTVEDRDRAQGIYFVRYVDPATAGKEGPGFFSRMFSFGKSKDLAGPARYRVQVKEEGVASTVTVQDATGAPERGEAGQRIVAMLVEDMK